MYMKKINGEKNQKWIYKICYESTVYFILSLIEGISSLIRI